MSSLKGLKLGLAALVVYIIGGIFTFTGIALFVFWKDDLVWGGIGTGRALGALGICVGLLLSILGVLLMRIFRNRGLG